MALLACDEKGGVAIARRFLLVGTLADKQPHHLHMTQKACNGEEKGGGSTGGLAITTWSRVQLRLSSCTFEKACGL
jgi:hypothetical protein